MYLLDTDILSLLHRGDERVERNRNRFEENEIATTIVTRIELLRGRFDFVMKAADGVQLLRALQWLRRSEELLTQIRILSCDEAAAAEFDKLRLTKGLGKIDRNDLLIASIALAHGDTVVTRNVKHFQIIPGLRVENWAT